MGRKIFLYLIISVVLFATEANYQNVTRLYVATFNRAPDAKGLDYWVLKSNASLEDIAMSFFQQEETRKKYPSDSTIEYFINQVYHNLFDRSPDQGGMDYWRSALASGDISRSLFILAVINGAVGEDAIVLENKEEAGIYFAFYGYNDIHFASNIMTGITSASESVNVAREKLYQSSGTESSSVCIYDDIRQNRNMSTACFVDLPANLCRGSTLDKGKRYAFRVRGECVSLGYPKNSLSTDASGFSYYHASGLYHTIQEQPVTYKLTHSAPKSSQNPCFSPDGKYLLYTRFLNGYNIGPSELVKIRIDGGEEKVIVPTVDSDNVNVPFGSWVGHHICFASDRGGESDEIWIVGDDGSNLRQITRHPEEGGIYYIEPVFNPKNSEQIVFEFVQGENDANAVHKIAFLDVKSAKVTLLTDGSFDDRLPSWSNDGKKVLFQRKNYNQDEGWLAYIAEIDTQGTAVLKNIRLLSYGQGDYTDCSWSFDDQYILCSMFFWGHPTIPKIWMLPLDKELEPVQKTFNEENEDGAPSQSHNGNQIAFESHYGDSEEYPSEIWIIKE
jgi:TolB protein